MIPYIIVTSRYDFPPFDHYKFAFYESWDLINLHGILSYPGFHQRTLKNQVLVKMRLYTNRGFTNE